MNVQGDPYVIEYNCRMGDPETQVVFPRITNDIVELFKAAADGTLHNHSIVEDPQTAVAVVLTSGGYPDSYEKNFPIEGLDLFDNNETIIFHAATEQQGAEIVTNGGRVLSVGALGKNFDQAAAVAYDAAAGIRFNNKYYRRDIGSDL